MKPSIHFGISVIVAGGALAATRSWILALVSLVSGVLIDLDHFYEYLKARGKWISTKDFFEFYEPYQEKKVYVWLHAYEWVALGAAAAWLGWFPEISAGLALGMFHHLMADQLGNGLRWNGYFIGYRWWSRFDSQAIFQLKPGM